VKQRAGWRKKGKNRPSILPLIDDGNKDWACFAVLAQRQAAWLED
jgi:hypothetical protein